jgi:hypothetical protein
LVVCLEHVTVQVFSLQWNDGSCSPMQGAHRQAPHVSPDRGIFRPALDQPLDAFPHLAEIAEAMITLAGDRSWRSHA